MKNQVINQGEITQLTLMNLQGVKLNRSQRRKLDRGVKYKGCLSTELKAIKSRKNRK